MMCVPVEVSARHTHLSQDVQDILFGSGYQMKIVKDLSQHGQWAAEEKITVKGPKGDLEVRVLGPCRPKTQVEITKTECRMLGIPAVVRVSGDVAGTPGVRLIGPAGELTLEEGAMVVQRHVHMSDKQAADRNLVKGQKIKVRVAGVRGVVFEEVFVRVHPTFELTMHIDTDEGNACGAEMKGGVGEIIA
ncbi:phosphate propanoyltransferase [Candidatus Uhrbacteria bacterium]|nr:phosphate propanoyltransferase [Candidatus Uhrbacteria bacterium]